MAKLADISDQRWGDILDLIESGKVIPIVGRRMSLVDNGDGKPVPLQQAVAERLAKELGVDPLPPGWGLNELYMSAADKNAYNVDAFHPKLKRVLGGMKPYLEPLRRIAEITSFRMFLSTAIDGFLEQAVREVRSPGETVTSFTFAPGSENPRQPIGQHGEVCVYNLLGSRETCPNWAVTVEGLVEFVLGLQSEKYRPEQLFGALKDHHLLAVGCQIPDWLGRFFLRSLRDGPISAQKASNFLIENQQDADVAFGHYLELFGRQSFVVPDDAFAFVDELNRRWKERVGPAPPPPPPGPVENKPPAPAPGAVFLSYSHEDGTAAQDLYDFLRAQGIDVWKDDRDDALKKGGNWENEIRRRIADCACFVPMISPSTEGRREGFFWKEWNLALNRRLEMDRLNSRFIFPVVCKAGLAVPEQFSEMQWTVLTDRADLEALARALRTEQRSLRKERR